MNREQESEHLRKAERHVAEAKELVERQRGFVEELTQKGHDTEVADATLRALEGTLRAFERHRDQASMPSTFMRLASAKRHLSSRRVRTSILAMHDTAF